MPEGFANSIIGGAETLIRSAIKSVNFVLGISGWRITRTGSAEFNDLTARGSITAGGGNVTLNASGIQVLNPSRQYDINGGAGFLARRIADDGTYAQMTVIDLPSLAGGFIGFGLRTPTLTNGNDIERGDIFVRLDVAGAVDSPHIKITSPKIQGKADSSLIMWGVASDDSPSRTDLTTDDFYRNGVDQGRGWFTSASDPGNSAAIGNVETVVLTTPVEDWESDRAYICLVTGGYSTSAPTNRPIWRLRKTNTAGQLLAFAHGLVSPPVGGSNATLEMSQVFTVANGGVNAALVFTAIGSAAFTVTMTGGNGGRMIDFFDVGPRSRYPNAFVLV